MYIREKTYQVRGNKVNEAYILKGEEDAVFPKVNLKHIEYRKSIWIYTVM